MAPLLALDSASPCSLILVVSADATLAAPCALAWAVIWAVRAADAVLTDDTEAAGRMLVVSAAEVLAVDAEAAAA